MRGDETVETVADPLPGVIPAHQHTRREVLVRTGVLGAAISLSGLLAACGSSDGPGGTQSSGAAGAVGNAEIDHLTWGFVGQTPTGLDLAGTYSIALLIATSLGLEGLLTTDSDLKLRPALAKGWSQPDLLHYVFDIRAGVKFWDGSSLTVDDVVFSLERHLDEEVGSQVGYLVANIKAIEAKSDTRIVITMTEPDPTIPQVLTILPILPKKYVEKVGADLGTPGSTVNMMGTGPFEITSFTTENGVEVQRNKSYWGKAPKVKSASLKFFETPQTMLLAARSGAVDGGFGFPLSEADAWANVPSLVTDFPSGVSVVMLSFDLEAEPWNDIHVRRAVAHCCDTAGYAKAFLGGQATPATSMVPKGLWSNVADPGEVDALYGTLPQYPFSLDEAKAELAKSAFPDGFSATVPYLNTQPPIGRALVSLSESLKQIGIDLEVKPLTESQWLTTVFEHKDLGLQATPYSPDYNDPSNYPLVFLPSANAAPNALNTANFKNSRVDRLLDEQASTSNNEERTKLLGEVLEIVGTELPYFPLWWEGPALAINEQYVYNGFNPLYYFQAWLNDVGVSA